MNSHRKLIVTVVSFLLFISPAVLADTVILQNGKELKVEKIWPKGDKICFIFHTESERFFESETIVSNAAFSL